jgi:hypothetical protein
MADNLLSTLLYPDAQVEASAIQRQQALADMLRQQSFQPQQQEVINGLLMPVSNMAGFARLGQGYMAGDMQDGINDRQIALNQKMAQALRAQLEGPQAGLTSQPADYGMGAGATGLSAGGVSGSPVAASSNPYNIGNLIRASAIGQISPAMASVYADGFKTPDAIKTMDLTGQNRAQMGQLATAKAQAESVLPIRQGQTIGKVNADGSVTPTFTSPDFDNGVQPAWKDGKPSVSLIPGANVVKQAMTQATEGAKAQYDPVTAYKQDGTPVATNRLSISGNQLIGDNPQGGGLDLSKMSREQIISLAQQDPEGFARSVQRPAPDVLPAPMPGQTKFLESKAGAAADRSNDLVKTVADAPNRIAVLDKVIELSKGGVSTGPTAEWKNNIKGIAADTFGIKTWKDDVSDFQEISKMMNQNAIRAWQAAGGSGTDAQLEAQTKANVRAGLFPQAVQDIAQWNKAGELALMAKATASQKANLSTPQQQAGFEENWRSALDPKVFQLKVMSPTDASKNVDNLKKTNPQGYQSLLSSTMRLKELGGL